MDVAPRAIDDAFQLTASDRNRGFEGLVVLFGGGDEAMQPFQSVVFSLRCNGDEVSRFQRPFDHHDRNAEVEREVGECSQNRIWMDTVL